jgi:hypothetical protein
MLRGGQQELHLQKGQEILYSQNTQINSGAHRASYFVVKAMGAGERNTLPSNAGFMPSCRAREQPYPQIHLINQHLEIHNL